MYSSEFDYHRARSLADAHKLLAANPGAKLLAGGHSLIPLLKLRLASASALIGSPQQVIDKVGRYHERLGHEVIHLSADNDGVTPSQKLRTLELFQSEVAPALRVQIPSRPLAYSKQGAGCR